MQLRTQALLLLTLRTWIHYVTILSLSFLICAVRTAAVAALELGGLCKLLSIAPGHTGCSWMWEGAKKSFAFALGVRVDGGAISDGEDRKEHYGGR